MRTISIGLVVGTLVTGCHVDPQPTSGPAPAAVPNTLDAGARRAPSPTTASTDATAALDDGRARPGARGALFAVPPPDPADTADGGADPRAPIPAPAVTLTDAGKARFAKLPDRDGAIPVLLFHQICPGPCPPDATYGMTQLELTKTMLAIGSAGYTTISVADYVRAHGGDAGRLGPRPILITFDDGRLDAYRGADDVLRLHGARATMFVMTIEADRHPSSRMQWADIEAGYRSGRWDPQLHAHAGHVLVPTCASDGGAPTAMSFYAARECIVTASAGSETESFDAWKVRTESDIALGQSLLASHVGGSAYAALTFAVPFGDYGQKLSNDPRIQTELRAFLDAHFAVWFTQPSDDPDFTTPSRASHEAARFTIVRTTTAENVYDWLARHASPPVAPPASTP
jgi:hypothetical protein